MWIYKDEKKERERKSCNFINRTIFFFSLKLQIVFVFSVFYSFKKIFVNNSKENENAELVIVFTKYLSTFQYSQILAVSQFYPPFLLASSPSFLDAWNRFVSRLIDNRVLFTMDTIKESHILLYYSFDFGERNM